MGKTVNLRRSTYSVGVCFGPRFFHALDKNCSHLISPTSRSRQRRRFTVRRRGQQPRLRLLHNATIINTIAVRIRADTSTSPVTVPFFTPPPAFTTLRRPPLPSATATAAAAAVAGCPGSPSSQASAATATSGRRVAASWRRDQTIGRKGRSGCAKSAGDRTPVGGGDTLAPSTAVRRARGGRGGGIWGGEARPRRKRRVQQLPLQAF